MSWDSMYKNLQKTKKNTLLLDKNCYDEIIRVMINVFSPEVFLRYLKLHSWFLLHHFIMMIILYYFRQLFQRQSMCTCVPISTKHFNFCLWWFLLWFTTQTFQNWFISIAFLSTRIFYKTVYLLMFIMYFA